MENLTLSWWMWMLGGLLVLMLEIFSPAGFYLFFFGSGAIAVGIVSALGLTGPLWFELLLFSLLSIGALVLFRRKLVERFNKQAPEVDTMVGEVAVILEDIPAGQTGQAERRGTVWSARNCGEARLTGGQRCPVEKVEGLVLFVREQQQ